MKNKLSLNHKLLRSTLVLLGFMIFFGGLFATLYYTGLWESINSVEKMRSFIQGLGFWGRLAFVFLQFLQVTIIPIPSTILTIAGAVAFGPLQGSILSLSGILLGSAVAFFLGQTFGKGLVEFMVGEESCKKWTEFLSKGKYTFFIMMFFPMFPDDILCLVAGLTNMSWKFFMITNIISRPIGVFLTSYLGSGDLIPYSGWGLVVWGFILLFVIILMVLSVKYQKQIEKFLLKKTNKIKN